MPVAQHRGLAGGVHPVGVNQRMLGGGNDLDIFEAGGFHAIGDELGGPANVVNVFGKSAYTWDAQEGLELVEKARLVLFDKGVSGLRHTLL